MACVGYPGISQPGIDRAYLSYHLLSFHVPGPPVNVSGFVEMAAIRTREVPLARLTRSSSLKGSAIEHDKSSVFWPAKWQQAVCLPLLPRSHKVPASVTRDTLPALPFIKKNNPWLLKSREAGGARGSSFLPRS